MNITIDSKTLAAASRLAHKVANNGSSLPILQHVKLQSGTECLAIYATDLDTSVMVVAPGHTDTEGECCVPAKRLTDIAASCKGAIELDLNEEYGEGGCLDIINGERFSVETIPAEDFPAYPPIPDSHKLSTTTTELRRKLGSKHALLLGMLPETNAPVLVSWNNANWTSFMFRSGDAGELGVQLMTKCEPIV